ncbi:MAG TPA: glucose-6-phosphate isomerase family protein, partial [Phototrophicaceae bacterium]|nr:glucose-6-phosphate isomerase family protein [Phototrophicaceae bacterium]
PSWCSSGDCPIYRDFFFNREAEATLLATNPIIYEVYEATQNPKTAGQLLYSTTVISPGKVGNEYYMTKGHYHALRDRAEFYFGLRGTGYLILQTPEGQISVQPMPPGTAAYVPPYWGHRTINVGSDEFAFLAVYPADAGYDYGTISETGFASIVIEQDGQPQVVPNPRYRP